MPLLVRLLVPAILPMAVRRQRRDLERRIVTADIYSFSADAQTRACQELRRLAGLPADDRPLPSVAAYDDLLGKASS